MASADLDKKAKEVKAESDAAAEASASLQKAMDALKKAQSAAAQAKKELSGEEDE
jgi:hypothetical protein